VDPQTRFSLLELLSPTLPQGSKIEEKLAGIHHKKLHIQGLKANMDDICFG